MQSKLSNTNGNIEALLGVSLFVILLSAILLFSSFWAKATQRLQLKGNNSNLMEEKLTGLRAQILKTSATDFIKNCASDDMSIMNPWVDSKKFFATETVTPKSGCLIPTADSFSYQGKNYLVSYDFTLVKIDSLLPYKESACTTDCRLGDISFIRIRANMKTQMDNQVVFGGQEIVVAL